MSQEITKRKSLLETQSETEILDTFKALAKIAQRAKDRHLSQVAEKESSEINADLPSDEGINNSSFDKLE